MKPKSTREKYQSRKILLSGEKQRETVLALVRNLPIDPIRPLEVVIREEVKKRSLDANAYYWVRVGEIAEQAFLNGRRYDSEVWHEYFKRNVLMEQVVTKDGQQRSKWTEMPDGTLTVISTTALEKSCFHDYTTAIEAFGAELGVCFSANPRDYL